MPVSKIWPLSWWTDFSFSCWISSCLSPKAQQAHSFLASLPPSSSSLVPGRRVSVAPLLPGAGGAAPGNSYEVWASGGCGREGNVAAPQTWWPYDPRAPYQTSPRREGQSVWDPQRHPREKSSVWLILEGPDGEDRRSRLISLKINMFRFVNEKKELIYSLKAKSKSKHPFNYW